MDLEKPIGQATTQQLLIDSIESDRHQKQMDRMESEEQKANTIPKQASDQIYNTQNIKSQNEDILNNSSENSSQNEAVIEKIDAKQNDRIEDDKISQISKSEGIIKRPNSANSSQDAQESFEQLKKGQKEIHVLTSPLQNNSTPEEQKKQEEDDEQRIFGEVMSKAKSKKEALENFPNVLFYAGKLKSNFGRSDSIQAIHGRFQNYRILEYDHAYIQWIFPNKYQSNFNMSSASLNDQEIEIFLKEPLLAKRYIKSYEMMLDFYGMSIKNYKTGELKRNQNYLERYEDAVCGHNVLRIRRILTSLNNFGFRRYAISLCKFLEKEIKEGDRPLKRRNGDYLCDWQMYGECKDENEQKLLEKNCFQKFEKINRENIYLKQIDDHVLQQQKQQQ